MSEVPPQEPWTPPGGDPPQPGRPPAGDQQPQPGWPPQAGWDQPPGQPHQPGQQQPGWQQQQPGWQQQQPGWQQQQPGWQQQQPGWQQQQPGWQQQQPGWQQQPGGYQPPPGAWQQGPGGAWGQAGTSPQAPLASWGTRVLGWLIDWVLVTVVIVVLDAIGMNGSSVFQVLAYVVGLAAGVFLAFQVGQSGATPGMRVVGIRCVSARTGEPIGAGMAVLRWLAHIADTVICYIGWLFPLWDRRRQTLADKIVGTVVTNVPKQSLSLMPKARV